MLHLAKAKASVVVILLTVAGVLGAHAASIQSCGGPSDLLKNVVISVDPDPIDRSRPFTITAKGTLGAAVTEVFASADLDATISLMGVTLVDGKVRGRGVAKLDNLLPAGDAELIVGPVELQRLPGHVELTGKIILSDVAGKQVACVALDLDVPLLSKQTEVPTPPIVAPEAAQPQDPPALCGKPKDHLHDISIRQVGGGMTEVSGTFDEDISDMNFVLDGHVRAGWIPVHVALTVPVTLKPGFKKGTSPHISFGLAPAPSEAAASSNSNTTAPPKIHVKGTVTWNDAGNEEVACLSLAANAERLEAVPSAGKQEGVVVV